MHQYTFQIQKDGKLWVGWVKECAGVNSQAATKAALIQNLHSALSEYLNNFTQDAKADAGIGFSVVVEQDGNKPIREIVFSQLEQSMDENSELGKLLAS